ncbi:MAG: DUF1837 domain-containing protein [Leptolyngbya sp. SIO1D8]|nr:DUF1837 domain-containing protein [Leptolyngbya sp. SIO1D8]
MNAEETQTQNDDALVLREALLNSIHPGPSITEGHLETIERNIEIAGTKTKVHCYSPSLDGNGRVRIKALAEFLRERVLQFVVPRSEIDAAEEHYQETNDPSIFVRLHERAKSAFTPNENSGEGGEFLLYAIAEKEFSLAQLLCKMSLKTSAEMHYHGADGIFASIDDDGYLNIFWGESKLYSNASQAITDCLKSLAPHLIDELGEGAESAEDIILLNEYANIGDDTAEEILKRFLNPDHPNAKKLRVCGIALVTFDEKCFPAEGLNAEWEEIDKALRETIPKWQEHVSKRVGEEKIGAFDIQFIFLPMHSADAFRKVFLKLLRCEK